MLHVHVGAEAMFLKECLDGAGLINVPREEYIIREREGMGTRGGDFVREG